MWVRSGHEIRQENKRVLMDLLDILAFPSPDYKTGAIKAGGGKKIQKRKTIDEDVAKKIQLKLKVRPTTTPPHGQQPPSPLSCLPPIAYRIPHTANQILHLLRPHSAPSHTPHLISPTIHDTP